MTRNHNGHSLQPISCKCGECGGQATTASGKEIYPHRPDLADKRHYLCSCGAYVGVHPETWEPLGTPASSNTRKARSQAHAHFDALHEAVAKARPNQLHARKRGYAWLAKKMELSIENCHIGMMTRNQAQQVVALCQPELKRMRTNPKS